MGGDLLADALTLYNKNPEGRESGLGDRDEKYGILIFDLLILLLVLLLSEVTDLGVLKLPS